jgi:hypothetical protein
VCVCVANVAPQAKSASDDVEIVTAADRALLSVLCVSSCCRTGSLYKRSAQDDDDPELQSAFATRPKATGTKPPARLNKVASASVVQFGTDTRDTLPAAAAAAAAVAAAAGRTGEGMVRGETRVAALWGRAVPKPTATVCAPVASVTSPVAVKNDAKRSTRRPPRLSLVKPVDSNDDADFEGPSAVRSVTTTTAVQSPTPAKSAARGAARARKETSVRTSLDAAAAIIDTVPAPASVRTVSRKRARKQRKGKAKRQRGPTFTQMIDDLRGSHSAC